MNMYLHSKKFTPISKQPSTYANYLCRCYYRCVIAQVLGKGSLVVIWGVSSGHGGGVLPSFSPLWWQIQVLMFGMALSCYIRQQN